MGKEQRTWDGTCFIVKRLVWIMVKTLDFSLGRMGICWVVMSKVVAWNDPLSLKLAPIPTTTVVNNFHLKFYHKCFSTGLYYIPSVLLLWTFFMGCPVRLTYVQPSGGGGWVHNEPLITVGTEASASSPFVSRMYGFETYSHCFSQGPQRQIISCLSYAFLCWLYLLTCFIAHPPLCFLWSHSQIKCTHRRFLSHTLP